MGLLDIAEGLVAGATGVPKQLPTDFCTSVANTALTKATQQLQQLIDAWKVKELYFVGDINRILLQTYKMLASADAQAVAAIGSFAGDTAGLKGALAAMRTVSNDGSRFWAAIADAQKTGARAIKAPDLEVWVRKATAQAAWIQWWITYTQCRQPALAVGLTVIAETLGVLITVVKAIVEAVVEVGEAIVNAASAAAGMITYIKWGAILLGVGFLAYKGHQLYREYRPALHAGGEGE